MYGIRWHSIIYVVFGVIFPLLIVSFKNNKKIARGLFYTWLLCIPIYVEIVIVLFMMGKIV